MSFVESEAKSIISESGYECTASYQKLRELNYTGYTHFYLAKAAEFSKLTTTAKLSLVLKLAEYDLVGIKI